jgi:hypothetical protein
MDSLTNHARELTEKLGLSVEIHEDVNTKNRLFVIIKSAPLPPGIFKLQKTDILLVADRQYPDSALDMFWTEQDVIRVNGTIPQNANVIETYMGRSWRRFSWHRNGIWKRQGNPLLDHYLFTQARWEVEKQ